MRRRRFVPLLGLAAVVASSCASGPSVTVPSACPQGDFLAAVDRYVPGSAFIDTPWEPAPDTDMKAAFDAGGIACSYGIQEAEVGATILWAPDDGAYVERRATWIADGQEQVDVDGADDAWARRELSGTETHLWALNLLVDGAWIQVNTTFLSDLHEAQPLIDAAIAVVRD